MSRKIAGLRSVPILVTGMHRSGTTWVGKMLSASGEAVYIHEPLNPLHAPGLFGYPVDRYYFRITEANEAEILPEFCRTLGFRYRLVPQLRVTRSPKAVKNALGDMLRFSVGRMLHRRPLLKDPFAVFSIPWFVDRFDAEVVVVVRHPLATVSSLKRLGWEFDPAEVLSRSPGDTLQPTGAYELVEQGALLWRAIAETALENRASFPRVRIVRHEDLVENPIAGFADLYGELGLSFNQRARRRVERSTSQRNPREAAVADIHQIELDSRASLLNWTRRLTSEEVASIRELAQPVLARLYLEDDWVEELFARLDVELV